MKHSWHIVVTSIIVNEDTNVAQKPRVVAIIDRE